MVCSPLHDLPLLLHALFTTPLPLHALFLTPRPPSPAPRSVPRSTTSHSCSMLCSPLHFRSALCSSLHDLPLPLHALFTTPLLLHALFTAPQPPSPAPLVLQPMFSHFTAPPPSAPLQLQYFKQQTEQSVPIFIEHIVVSVFSNCYGPISPFCKLVITTTTSLNLIIYFGIE